MGNKNTTAIVLVSMGHVVSLTQEKKVWVPQTSKFFKDFSKEVKGICKQGQTSANRCDDEKFEAFLNSVVSCIHILETGETSFEVDLQKSTTAIINDFSNKKSRSSKRSGLIQKLKTSIGEYSERREFLSGKDFIETRLENDCVKTIEILISNFELGHPVHQTILDSLKEKVKEVAAKKA